MNNQPILKNQKRSKQLGASMVEFALLIALVAVIGIPAVRMLGQQVNASFNRATEEIAGEGAICDSNHPNWPDCN